MSDDEEEETGVAKGAIVLPAFFTRKNDLREDLFNKILCLAAAGVKQYKLQKDIAQHIKQSLDTDPDMNELIGKGPWQVIVGRSFASAITHEAMHVAFFDLPEYQETILVYKSLGVQSV
ncbi:unnamed protein product [Polarella glacialis]|uniref:Dynein light chain n=1 Tax=Polarella glacialis TaxID=89957 RepID=A0A813JB89_POLGL|nr:unnamed protein product [Polarella glacialis]|mmetsp:Transcript_10268/g.16405  ORF Transcript_10268/g.16405 Transcript_10268/m.16405 type:complete len:119 (-) Transcript_10268:121-477(-)|eukprot:CAMPEP_0115079332 /NCGR_PEP_ID=MMETSP0227-20121206/18049_1 /TAXON_ID=89957 /ORGANISM="Polarella glacialis, Strain CCMP 1383" /LENGTH=118 /DNA_ID=CAMNT_0002466823 /DNA_START=72 /DNA_END=428 /DNA_ORIENTATION=-